jgi:hypothetical protein
MTTCELTTRAPAATVRVARPRRYRWLRELGLLLGLYVGYSAARLLGHADLAGATANAHDLLDLEQTLHIDVEGPVNSALDAWPLLAIVASYWYSLLHYVVTPAVLVWVYRRRHGDYPRVRNALVIASAIGLVGFTLLPMAPPRMLPGFVDTLATTADSGWWGGDASAPKGMGALTNQLAAMPSLHVGWAVWVAWVVAGLSTHRWVRMLALAYPVITTLVVVGTANHYLLDAVAGAVVVVVGFRLARWISRRPARPHGRLPGLPSLPAQRRRTHAGPSASSKPVSGRTVDSSS